MMAIMIRAAETFKPSLQRQEWCPGDSEEQVAFNRQPGNMQNLQTYDLSPPESSYHYHHHHNQYHQATFSNSSISNIQRPLTFYFEDPLVSSKAINVELKLKVSAAFVWFEGLLKYFQHFVLANKYFNIMPW